MTKPSVGRIVHYVSHGTPLRADGSQAHISACRAAVITGVHTDTTVSLCVVNPSGLFFPEECHYDNHAGDPMQGGTWHWPEQV